MCKICQLIPILNYRRLFLSLTIPPSTKWNDRVSRPCGAIPSGSVFGSEIRAGRDSRGGALAFAEIRRALPSSYRESRKAVSTVVFGPAVSLERSTPLMRPRHDSHAENKNISPPLARSEFLAPESGDPAPWICTSCICLRVSSPWISAILCSCMWITVHVIPPARRENSRLQATAKQCAAWETRDQSMNAHVRRRGKLTKSVT